jgi:hypothetical protein
LRLSEESHRAVEEFFQDLRGEPSLRLPPVYVYTGLLPGLLLGAIGMGAMTLGRRVFVSPKVLRRDDAGRLTMPGWLLVHEAAHVLQYERRGFAGFLRDYLRGYWKALRAGGSWGGGGRRAAYLAIAAEHEAHEAEDAYRSSRERKD